MLHPVTEAVAPTNEVTDRRRFNHCGLVIRPFWLAMVFVTVSFFAGPALADGDRIALVIGNGAYQHMPPLPNPTADAKIIAEVLSNLGFENGHVEPLLNADLKTFVKAVRSFGDRLRDAKIGVIYYSGHGMQLDEGSGSQSYLIPVDAELSDVRDAKRQGLALHELLGDSDHVQAAVIALLDACRDNPTVTHLTGAGTRGVPRSGLVPIPQSSLPSGTLVSYATAAGQVADDGNGRNSPYAAALAKFLPTPGQDIGWVLHQVRSEVQATTGNKQRPEIIDNLNNNITLARLHDNVTVETENPALPPIQNALAADTALWYAVRDSTRRDDIEAYLQRFPDGLFKGLARNRLNAMSHPDIAPAPANDSPTAAPQQGEPLKPSPQSALALVVPPSIQGTGVSHPDEPPRPSIEGAVEKVFAPSAFQARGLIINLDHITDRDQSDAKVQKSGQLMKQFLADRGNTVKCYAHENKKFECYAQDQDIAELALKNGIARAGPDAPAKYRDAEQEARKSHRGLWRIGA